MKRLQRPSDKVSRVGHILFWLFPDEDEWYLNGLSGTPSVRPPRVPMRKGPVPPAFGLRGRTRSVPKAGHAWMLLIALLLLGGFVGTSCA
jgi:hypothetical protein